MSIFSYILRGANFLNEHTVFLHNLVIIIVEIISGISNHQFSLHVFLQDKNETLSSNVLLKEKI